MSLDFRLASNGPEVIEMMNEGLVYLESRDLEVEILIVNVDAGKGFFGRQKTNVLTYTSDIYRGEFSAGPVLSGLLRALVGVNNLYRAAGHL